MKFIIQDWASNTMNWGEFDSFEDAACELNARIHQNLLSMGINLDLITSSGLDSEYQVLEEALEKVVSDFRGEYYIVECE